MRTKLLPPWSSFVCAASIRVRRVAQNALNARTDETRFAERVLGLSAHLFAIACYLYDRFGVGVMAMRRQIRMPTSVDESLDALLRLDRATLTPESLYVLCTSHLAALDAELGNRFPRGGWLTGRKLIRPIRGCVELGGHVLHWPLPKDPGLFRAGAVRQSWKSAVEQRIESSSRPPMRYRRGPVESLHHLGMHWQRPGSPRIVPVETTFRGEVDTLRRLARLSTDDQTFRIALCPMPACELPMFRLTEEGHGFHVDDENGATDSGSTPRPPVAHLREVLDAAAEQGVRLLAFPELSVGEDVRQELSSWLDEHTDSPVIGLSAGSFHVFNPLEVKPANEAIFMGSAGNGLFRHEKRGVFRVTREQYRRLRHHFRPSEHDPAAEIIEDIRWGSELRVLDTLLGRIAVLICADALDPRARLWVEAAAPDFLFVLSMTPKTRDFAMFAEQVERIGVSTLFVNAAAVCGSNETLAFAHLAVPPSSVVPPDGPVDPPARFRWQAGSDVVEGFHFHDHDGDPWQPLGSPSPPHNAAPAYLLRSSSGETPLALIVDLRQQLRAQSEEK